MAEDWPDYPPVRHVVECALHRRNIKLTCKRCRYFRIFQPHGLWWLFERRRWDDALQVVPSRFWCSRCAMVAPKKIKNPALELTRDAPTGEPLPMPEERAWKKIVSRYRS
jgi:hypothetical protein